jgi:hypothetical protein
MFASGVSDGYGASARIARSNLLAYGPLAEWLEGAALAIGEQAGTAHRGQGFHSRWSHPSPVGIPPHNNLPQ